MMRCLDCNEPVRAVQCTVDPRNVGWRFTAANGCGHDLDHGTATALWREGMRWYVPPLRGSTLIDAERRRHTSEEGYDPEHDAQYTGGELAWAAWSLIDRAYADRDAAHDGPPSVWPLSREQWPHADDPLRLLIITGSFIAAEIDRRLAAGEKP